MQVVPAATEPGFQITLPAVAPSAGCDATLPQLAWALEPA